MCANNRLQLSQLWHSALVVFMSVPSADFSFYSLWLCKTCLKVNKKQHSSHCLIKSNSSHMLETQVAQKVGHLLVSGVKWGGGSVGLFPCCHFRLLWLHQNGHYMIRLFSKRGGGGSAVDARMYTKLQKRQFNICGRKTLVISVPIMLKFTDGCLHSFFTLRICLFNSDFIMPSVTSCSHPGCC